MKKKKWSKYRDFDGRRIRYGQLLDFCWWERGWNSMLEYHLKAKIRKRKSGDIFEFVEDHLGRPCHFTHRLSALCWSQDDLAIIDEKGK